MLAHGGAYDLTLDFGYRADDQEEPVIESRVSMSWEHAVSMVVILERLIEQYESQVPSVGAIRTKLAEAEAAAETHAQATTIPHPENEGQ